MSSSDPLAALKLSTPATVARTDQLDATRASTPEARRAQMQQLAQEFEATLMNEMLSGWRNSLLTDEETDGENGGSDMSQMTEMVSGEFGRALSRSGGLGIADVLMRSFERQLNGGDSTRSTAAPIDALSVKAQALGDAAVPAALVSRPVASPPPETVKPVAAATTAVDGTVTSAYGWRPDPFTGQSRFHAGVDVRMAYGEPVPVAAAGRVSFVGPQGGYGLTVMVDHGDGLQTRYAHLSSTDVQVDDEVSSGQPIARSGSSGRSTGPHLHVELLSQGKPVDPGGLLKRSASVADWMAYRTPSSRSAD